MKRFFSLLTLLVMIVTTGGYVYAGDVYTLSFPNSDKSYTESTDGYFTINNGGNNNNAKYWCNYNGVKYNCGMKMNKGTISFTSTSSAKLTIVQAYDGKEGSSKKEPGYNPILDGTEITKDKFSTTNCEGCRFVEININAGSHVITSTKEIGIAYVQVEYTGSEMTQLTEPNIDFNNETGLVTISQTEKKDVYYTTDGTDPSATNGTKYESAFTVEDGTTIKAVAIGDGTTTINSNVASCFALLKTVTIQKPEIATSNGTVAISCATPGVTIKYSVNGGELQNYSYAFTLTEDGTVKAQALRDNCTTVESDEVSVTAVKNTVATKTIVLDWNKFDLTNNEKKVSNAVLKGKTGTDAEGYSIELNNNEKNWSILNSIRIDGIDYLLIKLSNGAENILHMPEGVKASRITFYSVINSTDKNTVCGWQNVNGKQEYKSIPMGALTKYPTSDTEYDVRVYPLDNVTDNISFTNAGLQLGFVIALDVVNEETLNVSLSPAGMGTFSSTTAYELPEGLTAYTATCDGSNVTLKKVEDGIVAADQGVVLCGEKNGKYVLTPTAAATTTDWTKNELKNTATAAVTIADDDQSTYVLVANADGKGQFARLNGGQTIPVGKAYLALAGTTEAKTLSLSFGGETTGINTVETVNAENNAYYTLSGQKTLKPAKGLYIHNGKKYIAK